MLLRAIGVWWMCLRCCECGLVSFLVSARGSNSDVAWVGGQEENWFESLIRFGLGGSITGMVCGNQFLASMDYG